MDDGRLDTDVIVAGGGPAGSAAAIACAQRGLRVRLFERAAFTGNRPGDHPGETLHPGVEALLGQLGLAGRAASVVGARHEGIWVEWGGTRRFDAFGADASGPWQGFQVMRPAFDALLLDRARALGVNVAQPCGVLGVRADGDRITGVDTQAGPVAARVVVDATGRAHWLARGLRVQRAPHSPRLLARYGYAAGACPARDTAPALVGDATGWLWTAMVRPGVYQWTRVAADGVLPPPGWQPAALHGLTPLGPARGADVTWRCAEHVARRGWFMVGDAAAILDPTSSHGILRALLSGLAAGNLIAAVVGGQAPAEEAAGVYQRWLAGWFAHDVRQLSGFYRAVGISGFG